MNRRDAIGNLAGLAVAGASPVLLAQTAFDHDHAAFTALLQKFVVPLRGGQASQVRYAGFAAERAALKRYLDGLSSVTERAFQAFGAAQQQAFLINAYNAFTIELILTRWPDLQSIKDLGGFLQSPWKRKWIALFGGTVSLDDIEHGMLRARGRYDEPRVHFAVNCASIGCPALREEAFVGERLEPQLQQQTARFMSDRSRNRYNGPRERLEISKIFDWYGDDFKLGHKGITSLPAFCAQHADRLADLPAERVAIRSLKAEIAFLDYDWQLNAVR